MIAQAHHAKVVGGGQTRFAVSAELEQTLFQSRQIGLDRRLGRGREAHQVRRHHVRHSPHVVAGEPRLTVQTVDLVVRLHGDAGQGAVHGAGGVDFDDADVAAPRDRVQRIIRPQRTQADHRVGVGCQFGQRRGASAGEVGGLTASGQIVRCGAFKFDVGAFEQDFAQTVGDRQRGQYTQRLAVVSGEGRCGQPAQGDRQG
ncbi:hypothetical protein D3C71_1081980 [compost metagenome]